jgi:hypothetical protein
VIKCNISRLFLRSKVKILYFQIKFDMPFYCQMILEPSPPLCQEDSEGTIAAEFENDREYCLGISNGHVEMILKKDNKDIKL